LNGSRKGAQDRAGNATTASEVASNAMRLGGHFHGESIRRGAGLAAQTTGTLRRIAESGTLGFLGTEIKETIQHG
jgi:hypothetical protein